MLEVLALFGGLWFWVIFATFSIIALYHLEHENFGWLLFVTVITIGIGFFVGPLMEVLSFYMAEPILAVLHGAGYFILGSIFSVYKWYTYIQKKRDRYIGVRTDFLRHEKVKGDRVPDELKKSWKVKSQFLDVVHGDALQPHRNKERLTNWIIFWPWSLLWTIFDDPFRKIAQWFIARLGGVYRGITKRALRGINEDIGRDYDE